MEDEKDLVIEPNYLKVKKDFWFQNLFWDYYVYIDIPEYAIDQLLINAGIKAKWVHGDFCKDGIPFIFSIIKVRPNYSRKLRQEVFPALHRKLIHKFGDEYLNFCLKVVNTLIISGEEEGIDISEIFSRPIAD